MECGDAEAFVLTIVTRLYFLGIFGVLVAIKTLYPF